jgi:hypothetical protein
MTNPSSNPAPATVQCPSCGATASGKFCNDCGSPLGAPTCRSCQATLPVGARFCNECGTPVAGRVAPVGVAASAPAGFGATPYMAPAHAAPAGSSLATALPWGIAAMALVAAVAFFSGRGAAGNGGSGSAVGGAGGMPPGAAPFANGGGASGAPDISNMSPRERAGRLYDRIMRYAEEGKRDSVEFFAPMALASFDLLGAELDLDARYDYGRVATEAGELGIAAAQADTILMASPTHLLGLSLAARAAERQGNSALAERSWKAFLAAKDSELARNLPEYQAHAADIEAGTRLAQGGQ